MHPMLVGKTPLTHQDVFFAREPATDAIAGFEEERLEPAFCQMQGGCQAGDSPTDDKRIVFMGHGGYYI